ncbi:MAG: hypothetical protein AAF823_00725 [Planctomycetota bacterium]
MLRLPIAWCLLAACLPIAGCANYGLADASFDFLQPNVDDREKARRARLEYPAAAQLGPDIQAVVLHRGSTIRVTNRSAEPIAPQRLWINQRYVADLAEPIAPGQTARLQLTTFINSYERPFPVDTFFKPDSGFPVVLVETHDPQSDTRRRLAVQPDRERDIVELVQAYTPFD